MNADTREAQQAEIDRVNEWLALPSAAETAIAFATEPEQSHAMESVSAAAIAYAREQRNYEMVVNATRLYLLARRKTTELLIADNMRVIDDMQFTPMQWSRRLKEYKVPAETLDGYFDHCIANGWNPSIAGMLREAYHEGGDDVDEQTKHIRRILENAKWLDDNGKLSYKQKLVIADILSVFAEAE